MKFVARQLFRRVGHCLSSMGRPSHVGLHGDGRFAKLIAQLAKTDVLILDDWGLEKMTLSQRNGLLKIMEDRHGLKSTLITSQLPIA